MADARGPLAVRRSAVTHREKMLAYSCTWSDVDQFVGQEIGDDMRASALLVALAAASACSNQASTEGAGDFRALADCSARMDAVAILYATIADTSSGDDASEMRSTGELRAAAARVLKAEAEKLAGAASAEVEKIISETKASIDAEREKKPFEEFGGWLGSEADRCAPLVQALIKDR